MRLLFLTPQLPYPPKQGTALRNWGLISHLSRQHEIWLMSFDERGNDRELPAPLLAACKQVAVFPLPRRTGRDRLKTLLTSPLPDMAWRLWSADFDAQLQRWLSQEQFDIVQIEGIELARYARHGNYKLIFDDHNCEYLMQQRWFERDIKNPRRWHAALYSFVQWQRLRTFERGILQQARATLCCSEEDRRALQHLDAAFNPHVIYNGIDVASYTSDIASNAATPPSVVFTGKMDFRPNIDAMLWFGAEIWPRIKVVRPDAQWFIVGQKPSPRLDVLRSDPSITITGEVPDPRPYIAQSSVYIAPLRVGGGTRFKLMEAMAMRKPIVTTTLGCEGFAVQSGREMIIADAPEAFANAVLALMAQPAQATAMTNHAHTFVSSTYDWSVIVPKLERIYAT